MSTIAFDATTVSRPQLRITRRGRAVLGALLSVPVAIVLAISALAGAPAQAGSTAPSESLDYITVASGESLWDLAAWVAPDEDPRDVVAQIVALNRISATSIHPGQRLAIPAQYSE